MEFEADDARVVVFELSRSSCAYNYALEYQDDGWEKQGVWMNGRMEGRKMDKEEPMLQKGRSSEGKDGNWRGQRGY